MGKQSQTIGAMSLCNITDTRPYGENVALIMHALPCSVPLRPGTGRSVPSSLLKKIKTAAWGHAAYNGSSGDLPRDVGRVPHQH